MVRSESKVPWTTQHKYIHMPGKKCWELELAGMLSLFFSLVFCFLIHVFPFFQLLACFSFSFCNYSSFFFLSRAPGLLCVFTKDGRYLGKKWNGRGLGWKCINWGVDFMDSKVESRQDEFEEDGQVL